MRYSWQLKCAGLWGALMIVAVLHGVRSTVQAEESLPSYEQVSGLKGNLYSVGSDTLRSLMISWAETFGKLYPDVKIKLEGKGSSTAAPGITQGLAQLGPFRGK